MDYPDSVNRIGGGVDKVHHAPVAGISGHKGTLSPTLSGSLARQNFKERTRLERNPIKV